MSTAMTSSTTTLNPLAAPFVPKASSATRPATHPRASLLGLPTEIRLQILEHVLAPTEGTIRIRTQPASDCEAAKAGQLKRPRYLAPVAPAPAREGKEGQERDARGLPPRRADAIYRRFPLPHQRSLLDDKDAPEAGPLHPAVLATCKTLHAEGLEFLYGPRHRFDFGSDVMAAYHFLRSLEPRPLALLRRVRLVWFLPRRESWLAPPGLDDEEALEHLDLVCDVLAQPGVKLDELQIVVTSAGKWNLTAVDGDVRKRALSKRQFDKAAWYDTDGREPTREGRPELQGFDFTGANLPSLAREAAFASCLARIRGLKKLTMQAFWHPFSRPATGRWAGPRLTADRVILMNSVEHGLRAFLQERMGLTWTGFMRRRLSAEDMDDLLEGMN